MNNASVKRSFVLLKVVPLCVVAENGTVSRTLGLLDTGAVTLITSNFADRLQLQGTPERGSINTVTHQNYECELNKI